MSLSTTTLALVTPAHIVTLALHGDSDAYRSASVGDKSRVRTLLADGIRSAIATRNLDNVDAWVAAEDVIKSASAPVKAPLDHQGALQARITDLLTAASLLASGQVTPDGMDATLVNLDDLTAYLIDGATPTQAAHNLAGSKITKSGNQYDLTAHIAQVAAQYESGTFLTVAQVSNTATDEAPSGYPHQGAVAARLFPPSGATCTLSTVTPAREGGAGNGRRGLTVN